MRKKTNSKRVNLSLSQRTVYLVKMLADRDGVPPTTKAAELLEQGLEAEEDRILVEMAEKRLDDLEKGSAKEVTSEAFWSTVERDRQKK